MPLRALFALLALTLSACPTPGQSGGLAEVDVSGFAARMRALCRSGAGAQASGGACAPREAGATVQPDAAPPGAVPPDAAAAEASSDAPAD
jgi:hypothetical protein